MNKAMKFGLAVCGALVLAGCGGGGGEFIDIGYDETGVPISVWVPEKTTQVVNNIQTNLYLFPLFLHQKTILHSYTSMVGTGTTSNFNITGTMTTPTVSSGTYSASYTTTINYQSTISFEGVSATPVARISREYNRTLNNQSLPDVNSTSTSYYDTSIGFKIGASSSSYYKVLDAATQLPSLVVAGDSGEYVAYKVYANSTKTQVIGRDVVTYKIKSVNAVTSDEYQARIEWITSTYNSSNVLTSVSTTTQDLVYSAAKGAASKTLSETYDDVFGTTTAHLKITRI